MLPPGNRNAQGFNAFRALEGTVAANADQPFHTQHFQVVYRQLPGFFLKKLLTGKSGVV